MANAGAEDPDAVGRIVDAFSRIEDFVEQIAFDLADIAHAAEQVASEVKDLKRAVLSMAHSEPKMKNDPAKVMRKQTTLRSDVENVVSGLGKSGTPNGVDNQTGTEYAPPNNQPKAENEQEIFEREEEDIKPTSSNYAGPQPKETEQASKLSKTPKNRKKKKVESVHQRRYRLMMLKMSPQKRLKLEYLIAAKNLAMIDKRIKESLTIGSIDIERCLAALQDLETFIPSAVLLKENPEILATMKLCSTFKGSDDIKRKARPIYCRLENILLHGDGGQYQGQGKKENVTASQETVAEGNGHKEDKVETADTSVDEQKSAASIKPRATTSTEIGVTPVTAEPYASVPTSTYSEKMESSVPAHEKTETVPKTTVMKTGEETAKVSAVKPNVALVSTVQGTPKAGASNAEVATIEEPKAADDNTSSENGINDIKMYKAEAMTQEKSNDIGGIVVEESAGGSREQSVTTTEVNSAEVDTQSITETDDGVITQEEQDMENADPETVNQKNAR